MSPANSLPREWQQTLSVRSPTSLQSKSKVSKNKPIKQQSLYSLPRARSTNRSQLHFKDRALLYLSRAIIDQSKRGAMTYEISAVYGVFFMNFRMADFERKFRTDVALMDRHSGQLFSNKLRMVFLQLPEFNKQAEDCENYFERWIYVLKNMEIYDRMPWAAQYAAFKRLSEICETAALTSQERDRYEESIKVYRDNIAVYEGAIAEGMAKGREEGREEERRNVARKLIAQRMATDLICQVTNLTAEQIESLKEQAN